MQLYNILSAEKQSELIEHSGKQRLTLSFYAYAKIENPKQFRDELFLAWNPLGVLGRIYFAHEGINAQLSLPAEALESFKNTLDLYSFMQNLRLNVAVEHDNLSFLKLTIKIKDKIVADGLSDATLDVTDIGTHLNAKEFNTLMDNSDTIVVDMRNHYESEVGHFQNAITPDVATFRESLPIIENQLQDFKTDKNILMYCTGGIRCEKASAYFKHKGFKNVFQLEGGIIEYTRQIKAQGLDSKFIGKNFVFDQRLGERITSDIISKCHQCGTPCDDHTNCENDGCHLLFIQCESCKSAMENCCSSTCFDTIHLPLAEQVKLRSGVQKGNLIFRKGKSEKLTFKTKVSNKSVINSAALAQKTRTKAVKKILIGKGEHYYPKPKVALFILDNNELKLGETLLICGPTTGNQAVVLQKMNVNGTENVLAKSGDKISFELPFVIRKSDKLFKIID